MYKYEISKFKGNNKIDYDYGSPKRKEELNDMIKNLMEVRNNGKKKASDNARK